MRLILLLALNLIFSAPAWAAYYGVLDNGEIMGAGKYKATLNTQALTENGGLNLGGIFDIGMSEEFGVRGLIGFGKTDFYSGALVKWMPVPDIENQPAMGFNAGLVYAKDGGVADLTVRIEPMLSKRLVVEATTFTPYLALPVGIRMRDSNVRGEDDESTATFQMVVGSQLQVERWKNLQFLAEIGIDLDNSPGYISVAGVFYFDQEQGFTLE